MTACAARAIRQLHLHGTLALYKSFRGTYKFLAILVDSQMHGAEAAAADLLLDHILIYPVHSCTIIVTAPVMRSGIECFLDSPAAGGRTAVMSDGALVGRIGQMSDHLRAAAFGGRGKVDMDAMTGQDAMGCFDLGR